MHFSKISQATLIRSLICSAVCCLSLPASAQLSGNATLTSDYVWRGSSQTRERPAVQAGVKYTFKNGLYASAWGSNVKYVPDNGAKSEFDLAAGWNGKITADLSLDVYALRYQYPSTLVGMNWNELNAAITWRDNYWFSVGHSSNAMASKTSGSYLQLGARLPINDRFRLEALVARYILKSEYADSYSHGAVSGIWSIRAPIELRATVHTTDSAAKQLFSNMAGTRAEIALQTSF